jgi:hypothetical protein
MLLIREYIHQVYGSLLGKFHSSHNFCAGGANRILEDIHLSTGISGHELLRK